MENVLPTLMAEMNFVDERIRVRNCLQGERLLEVVEVSYILSRYLHDGAPSVKHYQTA